jgi:hypothetical protein
MRREERGRGEEDENGKRLTGVVAIAENLHVGRIEFVRENRSLARHGRSGMRVRDTIMCVAELSPSETR